MTTDCSIFVGSSNSTNGTNGSSGTNGTNGSSGTNGTNSTNITSIKNPPSITIINATYGSMNVTQNIINLFNNGTYQILATN
jgi:hypothetical protein